MTRRFVFFTMTISMIFGASQVWASPMLVDWAFNDNRSVFTAADTSPDALPDHMNSADFDWDSGLGSITFSYLEAGNQSLQSFFDHEIVEGTNTYYNEYGAVHSIPATGQSWEIDEPGWVFGDIYDNLLLGQLDNSNEVSSGMEDDVSFAMGWDFTLLTGETALLTLILSEEIPQEGFYLAHVDPTGSHYFSSNLEIQSTSAQVPEPATLFLFATGLAGIAGMRFKSR